MNPVPGVKIVDNSEIYAHYCRNIMEIGERGRGGGGSHFFLIKSLEITVKFALQENSYQVTKVIITCSSLFASG